MRSVTLKKLLSCNPNYALVLLFFRVLLGFVYLTLFASLLLQIRTLIGSTGLLPIKEIVAHNAQLTIINFPTLHLFFNSDAALVVFLLIGIIFSLFLILGRFPKVSLIAVYVLYLSIAVAGRDFFFFQWDNLLLEVSFLTLFMPLPVGLKKPQLKAAPVAGIFLYRWLLFRLYFESGIAKILGGSGTWLNLTAMNYYYETAPLPSFFGWFAQQLLPEWFHVASIFVVFALELVVPLFIFGPRKFRIISFYVFAAFNLLMGLTANYGFFNVLTVVLGIFLLDDKHLHAYKTILTLFKKRIVEPRRVRRWHPYVLTALLFFIIPFSILEFWMFADRNVDFPPFVDKVRDAYGPFKVVNRYHLFPGIVRERTVIEIQKSDDSENWEQIILKHTPNGPGMPPFLPLYQARFPFQYSFLTLGRLQTQYFRNFITKLCIAPDDVKKLLHSPLLESPRFIKLDFYHYTFSEPRDLLQGRWWNKRHVGSSDVVACESLR